MLGTNQTKAILISAYYFIRRTMSEATGLEIDVLHKLEKIKEVR